MSEKKNINKLFQEKFENFEVIPDEIVWEHIEAKLKEKKKRRIIPFWWKLTGIAASLLLGFFIYRAEIGGYSGSVNSNHTVVNQGNTLSKTTEKSSSDRVIDHHSGTTVVSDETTIAKKQKSTRTGTTEKEENTAVAHTDARLNQKKSNTTYSVDVKNNISKKQNNVVVAKVENSKTKFKTKTTSQGNAADRIVMENSKIRKTTTNHKNTILKKDALAQSSNEKSSQAIGSEHADKMLNSKNQDAKNAVVGVGTNNQKSVPNSIIKQEEEPLNKKIDSTKIAVVEPNALEELLKEKENKKSTEPKLNRWQVSSNVAPIYFSSISNGSPLDDRLKDNNKSYSANNQSYGIGTSYALNKKLKIRTGINILNVDYNTNGIAYSHTESVSGKLTNLNPNLAGSSIIIENLSNVNATFNKLDQKTEGSLNQKLGYIEMPLEVTYKVLDKKFGIDFIGGMSTMILNRNEIYLESSELNLKIGEATNLNNVHFSGNIGLGFKYSIFKNFEARVEPLLKYQFNTFSTDSGNFKPYMIGVYSGINFTF